jgi:glycosyltransferase involved in cell wall biosynthesis
VETSASFEPDAVRLARDLARALGLRTLVALGCRRPAALAGLRPDLELIGLDRASDLEACRRRWPEGEWVEWDPDSSVPPALPKERLRASILLCDALLERLEIAEPLLSSLRELLDHAPAAIFATPERDLARDVVDGGPSPARGQARGWNAAELSSLFESSGLRIGWIGLGRSSPESLDRRTLLIAVEGGRGSRIGELLASGPRNLLLDAGVTGAGEAGEERPGRVCIASYEFVGPTRTGGIGTSYTSLAEALARAGHEVTVLFTGWPDSDEVPFAHWIDHYASRGIELCELRPDELPAARAAHSQANRSYLAYLWLKERHRKRPFDVIHFPDTLGHGYYSLLARRQGWAFDAATIAVAPHSPSIWIRDAARMPFETGEEYADDYMERMSVAMADIVISPSAYMLDWISSRGWQVPERAYVQQHVPRLASGNPATAGTQAVAPPREVEEIVFFGRLEPRKGFPLFCDALDLLAGDDDFRHLSVLFLGKQGRVEGMSASDYLERRASRWPWECHLLDSLSQPEAISRLTTEGGRLVVMPSLVDNLPHTVQESLALGLRFIGSRVGGTSELIHPLDVARCTFDPWDHGDAGHGEAPGMPDPESLAAKLREALRSPDFAPARPAADPAQTEAAWVRWHRVIASRRLDPPSADNRRVASPAPPAEPSVCASAISGDGAGLERAAASLEAQDYPRIEVVRVEGEGANARNAAVGSVRADYLLFLAHGAEAKPGLVSALVRGAEQCGAEVVSCVCEVGRPGSRTRLVPVGGPRFAGLLGPWFGTTGYLVGREAFDSAAGFSAVTEPGSEDEDLLCRLALAGAKVQVVPEPLVELADEPAQDGSRPLAYSTSSSRSVSALYEQLTDERLSGLATTSQALWALRARLYEEIGTLEWETRYLGSKVREQESEIARLSSIHDQVVGSRSWRLTAPLRRLGRGVRRIRDR